MAGVISRVVTRLSALSAATAASYTKTDIAYDFAIGGLPFLAGTSPQRPLERATADFRKQQIDTDTEPGEQSLVSWWLRSQSSFHAGTGIKFEEPDQQAPNNLYRFQDSRGVDPWTIGQVTLLPATKLNKSSGSNILLLGCIDPAGPTDMYLQAEGVALYRVLDGSSAAITWGGAGTILALCENGSSYFAADSTSIWKGTLAGGAGAAIWNTGSSNVALGWVKQRLMAGIGPSIYDLSPSGAGGPALPAANYTHPNSAWKWTAICETPDSILAAGFVGAQSAVYRFTLDASGVVPTLTAGVIDMVMPEGELVYSLCAYLGTYVGIGTNKGVRLAAVDASSGTMQYGPLSVISSNPVRSIVGKDRFIFAAAENGIDGNSGVWRVDLGTQVDFRKFAYSTDLQTHVSGVVRSVGLLGSSGRMLIAVDGAGSYLEDTANKESTGYLLTGKIRMHTLEPKLFKYVRYRGQPLVGSVQVSVVDPGGGESTIVNYNTVGIQPYDEAAFNSSLGPQEYAALRFTLNRDAVATNTGPTFTGYQVKVLPASKRQRNYVIPLMCFDNEVDKYGVHCGGEGTAATRLEALETLEEAGDLVLLQDLNRNPAQNRLCVIDQLRFVQDAPPANTSGWGGYILATLRAV